MWVKWIYWESHKFSLQKCNKIGLNFAKVQLNNGKLSKLTIVLKVKLSTNCVMPGTMGMLQSFQCSFQYWFCFHYSLSSSTPIVQSYNILQKFHWPSVPDVEVSSAKVYLWCNFDFNETTIFYNHTAHTQCIIKIRITSSTGFTANSCWKISYKHL